MTGEASAAAPRPAVRLERVAEWVQVACLGWIAWLPVSQGLVLYPALLLVALTSLVLLVRRRFRPSRAAVTAWAVYYTWALTWTAVSAARGNPGVWHQAVLWLGLPLLWGTWGASLRGTQVRRTLAVLLGVGTLAGTLMLVLALQGLTGTDLLPAWLVDLQDMRVVVARTGEIEQNYLGLSSLVGVASLAVACAVVPGADSWLPRQRLVVAAAATTFAASAVSGRRGLLLVVLLVLLVGSLAGLVVALSRRTPPARLGRHVAALALGAGASVAFAATPLGANIGVLVGLPTATSAAPESDGTSAELDEFEALQAESDQLRSDQFGELIAAWRDEPLLGQGFGATLDSDFTRSDARPWMFEAEPLQVLMNVGVLGLLAAAAPVLLLLVRCWQALSRGRHVRLVVAGAAVFAAVVVASATNPYLQAPGHGWMLFLAGGLATAALAAPPHPADAGD